MLDYKKHIGCSIAVIIITVIIFARNTYGSLPFVPVMLGISAVLFLSINYVSCFNKARR